MTLHDFVYQAPGNRVVFARGAVIRLPAELDRLGTRRALLIAEPRNADLATADRRIVGHLDTVAQHVPEAVADDARRAVADADIDTLVVVGGGSAIGLGKAVALQHDVRQVALPTTYAGSEQTAIWGLSAGGRKRTGRDPRVRPDVVIYDPDLAVTMPPQVAGPSGMNALAHCVEATYAPGATPVTTALALEGIRLLTAHLPDVVDGRTGAVADVVLGAYLAGVALDGAGVGLHHKTCHVLGGMFGLDHGGMNAVLLGHVIAFNAPALGSVLPRIATAVDAEDPAAAVWKLADRIGAPTSLAALGMPREGLEAAAPELVAAAAGTIRPPDRDAALALLTRAYDGLPPMSAIG